MFVQWCVVVLGAASVMGTSGVALAGAPAPPAESTVADIVSRLGSDDFLTRDAAQRELETLRPSQIPLLVALSKGSTDLEIKARVAPRLAAVKTSLKFQFGGKTNNADFTTVRPGDLYQDDARKPWGFEPGAAMIEGPRYVTSTKPFYFSAALPEGNYRVKVFSENFDTPTDLTVKAELRRLMVENMHDASFTQERFVVNVRVPEYPGGRVILKEPREAQEEAWAWDEKLTLEFSGEHPNLTYLEIDKVDVPTIYLLGDSTMCDQSKEPWNSWGR